MSPHAYGKFSDAVQKFGAALLVVAPLGALACIYHSYRTTSKRNATFRALHLRRNQPRAQTPYDGCLRREDYALHKLFKRYTADHASTTYSADDIDHLRYQLLAHQGKRTTLKALLGLEGRYLLADHLLEPTGHVRDSPGNIARAVVEHQAKAGQRWGGEAFMTRTFGNLTRRLRGRSA